MKRLLSFLFLLSVLRTHAQSNSQERPDRTDRDMNTIKKSKMDRDVLDRHTQSMIEIGELLKKNKVYLLSNASQDIRFLLGLRGQRPDTFIIKKMQPWLSREYTANPVITIQTNNNTVSYTLVLSHDYLVFWNSEKQIWDINEIVKKD